MNTGGGGYQPAPTTVVVMPNRRPVAPYYLRQGVKVGGLALGVPCVGCLLIFGGFFVFSGIMALSMANYDDDFWDKFDRSHDPAVVMGSIMLTVGLLLVFGGVGLCCYAKEKYKTFDGTGHTNPGRIITPSPNMTAAGQQPVNPNQPLASPNQPAYPGNQPAYPGQPVAYPGQPGAPYGQPAPGMMPDQAGGMAVTYQYAPPGQAVPPPTVLPTTDPTGYPSAPAGYPTAPGGYNTAPGAYPNAPAGYPGAPSPYANASQPPATDYPVKGEKPPPYAP